MVTKEAVSPVSQEPSSAHPANVGTATESTQKRDRFEAFRSFIALAIIVLTLVISAVIIGLQHRSSTQVKVVRLPKSLRPVHYDLRIRIYPDSAVRNYSGFVRLFVECLEATSSIELHAGPLVRIYSVQLSGGPYVTRSARDGDVVKLSLDRELQPFRRYQLSMNFDGQLSTEDKGFFTDHASDQERARVVYVTQFEPNHARMAFPCFDEPAFKATYSITLVHHANLTARSNMPLISVEHRSDGLVADVFNRTPEMSTYVVAWLISDFVFKTKGKVTVWGEKHYVPVMDEALDTALRSLEYCEKFLNINYVLPKLDLVGVEKLSYAGMENWGLIVFNEKFLFGHDDNGPSVQVIAHETFHQWLGNLITASWWIDVWLQEAPTYYLAHAAAEALQPNQGNILRLLTDVFSDVHAKYERPTLFPENSTKGDQESKDVEKALQFATHSRAHHLIRMIHFLLGDEEFRASLKALVIKYKFKNLNGYEFLQTMTEVQKTEPKVDIQSHMLPWFESDGFPLVTFRRNYREKTISIKQEPFNNFEGGTYHVPLIYEDNRTQNVLQPLRYNTIYWLTEQYVQLPDPHYNETALLLNPGMIGYFVINYDNRNWALIGQFLARNPTSANIMTIGHLLHSSERLYELRKVTIDTVLWTWESLRNVSDWEPWSLVLSSMLQHDAYFVGFKDYERYEVRLLQTLGNLATTQTFHPVNGSRGEPRDFAVKLRNFLCGLDFSGCVQRVNSSWPGTATNISSYDHFERWLDNTVDARPETVLCLIVRHRDQDTWDMVLSWRDRAEPVKRAVVDIALTCSKNASLVKRAIKDTLGRGVAWTELAKRMPRQGHIFQRAFLETIQELTDNELQKLGKPAEWAFSVGALYVATEDDKDQLEAKMGNVLGNSASADYRHTARSVASKRIIDEAGFRYWLDNELPPAH